MTEPQKICVDLDGTLTEGEKRFWVEDPEPDEKAIRMINDRYKEGHTIVIWTARTWEHAAKTAAWLTKHGVMYHGLKMEKGGADHYIDDKTIDIEDYKMKGGELINEDSSSE